MAGDSLENWPVWAAPVATGGSQGQVLLGGIATAQPSGRSIGRPAPARRSFALPASSHEQRGSFSSAALMHCGTVSEKSFPSGRRGGVSLDCGSVDRFRTCACSAGQAGAGTSVASAGARSDPYRPPVRGGRPRRLHRRRTGYGNGAMTRLTLRMETCGDDDLLHAALIDPFLLRIVLHGFPSPEVTGCPFLLRR